MATKFTEVFLKKFIDSDNAQQLRQMLGISESEVNYMLGEISESKSPSFTLENHNDSEEKSFEIRLTLPECEAYNAFKYLFRNINNGTYSQVNTIPQAESDTDNLDSNIVLVFGEETPVVNTNWNFSQSFTGLTGVSVELELTEDSSEIYKVYINQSEILSSDYSYDNITNTVTIIPELLEEDIVVIFYS